MKKYVWSAIEFLVAAVSALIISNALKIAIDKSVASGWEMHPYVSYFLIAPILIPWLIFLAYGLLLYAKYCSKWPAYVKTYRVICLLMLLVAFPVMLIASIFGACCFYESKMNP